MSRPQVAVVVTCYNLGRTVVEAVDSALNQTLRPAELLVVDDGSQDLYTLQVLNAMGRRGHTVLKTPNRGVCAARNLGIRQTVSPYIVLLDGDDILQPTYLQKAADRLETDETLGFVSCGMESFGEGRQIWYPQAPDLIESMTRGVVHVSSMFRRRLWLEVGGFDEGFEAHEEVDFWTSAVEHGYRGEVLPEPLLRYRIRSGSLYHSAVQGPRHARLMQRFYLKHHALVAEQAETLLLAKERFILEQKDHHHSLERRRCELVAEKVELDREIRAAVEELAQLGRPPVDFGELRTSPASPVWGLDRGQPVDRHYIARFLGDHRADICGRVLEIKDRAYTHAFGDDRVTTSDVLDVDTANSGATLYADLQSADSVPGDQYDCFILTQTLSEILDVRAALRHSKRILRPGGVLLCTLPANGRITSEGAGLDGDFWRFTEASIRSLFAEVFGIDDFDVVAFGNVLACTAFLHGFASHELTSGEIDVCDPYYPVVYGVRAVKSKSVGARAGLAATETRSAYPQPDFGTNGSAVLLYHRVSLDDGRAPSLCVAPAHFLAHLEYLRDAQITVLPLIELARLLRDGAAPTRTVALTFDDGYEDALTTASPLLEAFGFPATFFIVTSAVDGFHEFWWDTLDRIFHPDAPLPPLLDMQTLEGRRHEPVTDTAARALVLQRIKEQFYTLDRDERQARLRALLVWSGSASDRPIVARPMDAAALRRLAERQGHDLGVHTAHHVWLPRASPETLWCEIDAAKRDLEAVIGKPVRTFSFPHGGLDDPSVELVMRAGFEAAVTTEAAAITRGVDVHRIPRIEIADVDRAGFADLLARHGLGAHPVVPREMHVAKTADPGRRLVQLCGRPRNGRRPPRS